MLVDGYWYFIDLVYWDFVIFDKWLFDSEVVLVMFVVDGKLFLLCFIIDLELLLYFIDFVYGYWKFWIWLMLLLLSVVIFFIEYKIKLGQLLLGLWDLGLFQDNDGKVYMYWGLFNVYLMYGQQIDFKFGDENEGEGKWLVYVGEMIILLWLYLDEYGWECFGCDYCDEKILLFIEGVWMNCYGNCYYLQYVVLGIEYNVYVIGVYVSEYLLGLFIYVLDNLVGYKLGGFVEGVGYGFIFEDVYGNVWNIGINWIGLNWNFEWCIDFYLVGFYDDGQMWVDMCFGDFFQCMFDYKFQFGESIFIGWMLLFWYKYIIVLLQIFGYGLDQVIDENLCMFWGVVFNMFGQMFMFDFGGLCMVNLIQVNYVDDCFDCYGDVFDLVIQFMLEGLIDGSYWQILVDFLYEICDYVNVYVEFDVLVYICYVCYVYQYVGVRYLVIFDLCVFGYQDGLLLFVLELFLVICDQDICNVIICWKLVFGVVGYNVCWGFIVDCLYEIY